MVFERQRKIHDSLITMGPAHPRQLPRWHVTPLGRRLEFEPRMMDGSLTPRSSRMSSATHDWS